MGLKRKEKRQETDLPKSVVVKQVTVPVLGILVLLAAVVLAVVFLVLPAAQDSRKQEEIITVSTLQEIIDVSELSTFTAVYNGIAQVNNAENPESVDYYVSYEAKVNAGINFEEVDIALDETSRTIRIVLPPVELTEVNVDIASMDFIFFNQSVNTSAVTETAYKACEEDVKQESREQQAIYDLAQQNAKNVMTALIKPIVDQWDTSYSLVVE